MKAQVVPETLTDGSIVFNVMANGEAVAFPPTQSEAEELAEAMNKVQEFMTPKARLDSAVEALEMIADMASRRSRVNMPGGVSLESFARLAVFDAKKV